MIALLALTLSQLPPSAPAPAPPNRALIDAVAAFVERRVITTSEVAAEARLLLLERVGPAAAGGDVDEPLRARVLDAIVVQELLALEARRTGVAVREVDIDQRIASVRVKFGDADAARAFLAEHAIDEELLRTRARRDLAAEALLRRAFAEVRVSDDEAKALLATEPALVDVAGARLALEKRRRDATFRALLDRIRRDVEVRIVWREGGTP